MSKGFVAYVYENDKIEIQKLVQQYPDIETGGDLFGLWKDEKTVIIQQFIGPGKKCSRTTTSFHQDIEYLAKVGSLITTEEGLCNVGEWHSHHQIGMPKPSGADRTTVFSNMPHLGLERFVLFIASIKSTGGEKRSHDVQLKDIELRPFLFLGSTQDVVEGDIKIIRSENPHRRNIRKEIKDGAEVPKSTSTSTSHESEKKRRGGKGRGTPAQDETEKKNDTPTLQQQALASQTVPPYPDRSAKPERTTETEPYIDDASLGRKTQEDQQRARPEKDQYTERKHEEKGDQTQRRDNNENRSPNTGSAPPRDVGSQSPPTSPPTSQINTPQHSGTTQAWGPGAQRNVPPTTSAPPSFKQVYDDSLHYDSALGQGRGIPGNAPMLTNPTTSQHFSPHSGAAQHFSTGQGGHQGTQWQGNFPQQTYPPSSQKHTTQHPQTRGRETQRNIPPTGGAHSSSQNPQHPRYAQIESQISARDRDRSKRNMQSNQSYSPSSQAQAKGNSGTIAVTNLSAGGYF